VCSVGDILFSLARSFQSLETAENAERNNNNKYREKKLIKEKFLSDRINRITRIFSQLPEEAEKTLKVASDKEKRK